MNIRDFLYKKVEIEDDEGTVWKGIINDISNAEDNFEEDGILEDMIVLNAYQGNEKIFGKERKGKNVLVCFYLSEIKSIREVL